MSTEKHALYVEEFESISKNYTKKLGDDYSLDFSQNAKQITIKIKKAKQISILNCFLSEGQTSFSIQGKNEEISRNLKELLIQETRIAIANRKSFTLKSIEQDDFNTLLTCLSDVAKIKSDKITDKLSSFCFIDSIGAQITVTYYKTKTLLVQGRVTYLFAECVSICTELFPPECVKAEHFKFFEIGDDQVELIDKEISSHITVGLERIRGKIESIIAPSLVIINVPINVPDYSLYVFPILRGIEGILKKRISEENGELIKNFHDFFILDNDVYIYREGVENLFASHKTKCAVLDLYNFYYKQRHSLFHMDGAVEMTRIINYEDAVRIIKLALKQINNLCKNW